ncbi:MAG: hypothetical protein ACLQU6_12485, partial [Limisphaerales bacterium]
ILGKKQAEEDDLRTKVAANPEWQKEYGDAWDMIARVEEIAKPALRQSLPHCVTHVLAPCPPRPSPPTPLAERGKMVAVSRCSRRYSGEETLSLFTCQSIIMAAMQPKRPKGR